MTCKSLILLVLIEKLIIFIIFCADWLFYMEKAFTEKLEIRLAFGAIAQ